MKASNYRNGGIQASMLFVAAITAVMLLSATCNQPGQSFPTGPYTYGAGEAIPADSFDAMSLRRNDSVFLHFSTPNIYVPNTQFPQILVAGGPQTFKLVVKASASVDSNYTVNFNSPNYHFTIHVLDDVWPGDANLDGRRNMNDLMPIVHGIREQAATTSGTMPFSFPPDTAQLNHFYAVNDWPHPQQAGAPYDFVLNGRSINFKHVDVNRDRKISPEDAVYLMKVLGPLLPPDFLVDQLNRFHLKATLDTGYVPTMVILDNDSFGLAIPFNIDVDGVPAGNVGGVLGMVYTRPVTETDSYKVHHTKFTFDNSTVFHQSLTEKTMWEQRFWNEINVASPGNACVNVVDKPLDVGIFKKNGALQAVTLGARCGRCIVQVEDVMRPMNGTMAPVTLYQHVLNGLVYSVGNNGVTATAADCSSDSTVLDLSALCHPPVPAILRDGLNDDGSVPVVEDGNAWLSPDVWVRHSQDGLFAMQNPRPNTTEFVYVRIFNPGCTALQDVKVNVHWGNTKTAMSWPQDFSGQNGGLATTITMPTIPACGSALGAGKWRVPNAIPPLAGTVQHYTLIAEPIVGPNGSAMGTGNIRGPVLGRPQIASRASIELLDARNESTDAVLRLQGLNGATATGELVLTQIDGPEEHPLSNYGDLRIFNFFPLASTHALSNFHGTLNDFAMDASNLEGKVRNVQVGPGMLRPYFGVKFKQNVLNGAPIRYRYALKYIVGSTVYNSAVFEITIQ